MRNFHSCMPPFGRLLKHSTMHIHNQGKQKGERGSPWGRPSYKSNFSQSYSQKAIIFQQALLQMQNNYD